MVIGLAYCVRLLLSLSWWWWYRCLNVTKVLFKRCTVIYEPRSGMYEEESCTFFAPITSCAYQEDSVQ
jgi:hypothetical protein